MVEENLTKNSYMNRIGEKPSFNNKSNKNKQVQPPGCFTKGTQLKKETVVATIATHIGITDPKLRVLSI